MGSDFDGRMARETEEIICRLKAAAQRPTYAELEAENARLREALRHVAEHPEEHRGPERSYAVGWAFWNMQNIARGALLRTRPTAPATEQEEG